jgi:hypothetical protein
MAARPAQRVARASAALARRHRRQELERALHAVGFEQTRDALRDGDLSVG